MPIDIERATGYQFPTHESGWQIDDVLLYHLGLGAGAKSTDPGELAYTYEAQLKVLPTFGVTPVFDMLMGVMGTPGLEFNPMLMLHGEQEIELHQPIPVQARVFNSGRIAGIYDKGKAALVVLETKTRTPSNELLFVNRFSLFLRGEGGFGGPSGPKAGNEPPNRAPDLVVESPTLPQQALLYRLSGDKNPLHADPEFAKLGGFDRPILHGLCTYGIVCKAVVDGLLAGDVNRVARYAARFRGVVFPGETISTSMWREGSEIYLQASVPQRDTIVLSNAVVTLRSAT